MKLNENRRIKEGKVQRKQENSSRKLHGNRKYKQENYIKTDEYKKKLNEELEEEELKKESYRENMKIKGGKLQRKQENTSRIFNGNRRI